MVLSQCWDNNIWRTWPRGKSKTRDNSPRGKKRKTGLPLTPTPLSRPLTFHERNIFYLWTKLVNWGSLATQSINQSLIIGAIILTLSFSIISSLQRSKSRANNWTSHTRLAKTWEPIFVSQPFGKNYIITTPQYPIGLLCHCDNCLWPRPLHFYPHDWIVGSRFFFFFDDPICGPPHCGLPHLISFALFLSIWLACWIIIRLIRQLTRLWLLHDDNWIAQFDGGPLHRHRPP